MTHASCWFSGQYERSATSFCKSGVICRGRKVGIGRGTTEDCDCWDEDTATG